MSAPVTVFADDVALGAAAAVQIAHGLASGSERPFVLGCPAGRTPRTTFRAFYNLAATQHLDCRRLHVVLMDEYLQPADECWRLVPEHAHHSCRGFIERELRQPLNEHLPLSRQLPAAQVHVPDPGNPQAYERLLDELGGIDLFLLASGASDGHVGFNPADTPLHAATRVVALSEATRRDNVRTFPGFRSFDDTPTHGVSVGPGTITRCSRSALLLLCGESKQEAFRRVSAATGYDPTWPSTVVHACSNGAVFADRAAAGLDNR